MNTEHGDAGSKHKTNSTEVSGNQAIMDSSYILTPLVDSIALSESSFAGDVLFVNGNILRFVEFLDQAFIVSATGPEEGLAEALDYFTTKASRNLTELFRQAFPRFLETLANLSVKSGLELQSVDADEEAQKAMIVGTLAKLQDQKAIPDLLQPFAPYFAIGIRPFSETIIASVYKFLLDRIRHLSDILPNLLKTATALKKLELTVPLLRLSLCKTCHNYEFSFAPSLRPLYECAKCGEKIHSVALDTLTAPLNYLKLNNWDLSAFIFRYLTSKILIPVQIYPEVMLTGNHERAQVDVYVAETATGIECRLLESPRLASGAKVTNFFEEMRNKIHAQEKVGIERFICLSNLKIEDTTKVEDKLKVEFPPGKTNIKEIRILGWDKKVFLEFLKEEVKLISKKTDHKMTQFFTQRYTELKKKEDDSN